MPTYIYRCPTCGARMQLQRKIADRDNTTYCFCDEKMDREVAAPMPIFTRCKGKYNSLEKQIDKTLGDLKE